MTAIAPACQPASPRRRQQTKSLRLAVVLVVAFMSLWNHSTAHAQQRSTRVAIPDDWDFGFDLFHSMLEAQGLRQQAAPGRSIWSTPLDRLLPNPSQSVLILTGSIPDVDGRYILHRFIADGGIVLIATDQRLEIAGFFRTQPGPVRDAAHAQFGHDDCLNIPIQHTAHSLVYGVNSLVTNQSGWIDQFETLRNYRWSTLSSLPSSSTPKHSRRKALLAVAESATDAQGKLIVLADESILTNSMLWYGDNQILALNLVRELSIGDRTDMLFLRDGKTVSSRIDELLAAEVAQMKIPPNAIPPEALRDLPAEALLGIGNAVLSDIEDSNILNELIVNRPRRMPARFYSRAILFTLCGIALVIFLILAWRGSQTLLPWARTRQVMPASQGAAVVPLSQAAAALARDACRMLTGSNESEDWTRQLDSNGAVGQQLVNASRRPADTRRTLDDVLEWTSAPGSSSLSKSQFEDFGQRLYDLKQLKPADERVSVS